MGHHYRSPESPRSNRRQFLLSTGSAMAAGVIAHGNRLINEFTSPQPYKQESKMKGTKPSIVFCHGIWADGSCFGKIIPALQAEGHQCIAAQYSLNTTADDIATVKRTLARVSSSPAILVGHSYGGRRENVCLRKVGGLRLGQIYHQLRTVVVPAPRDAPEVVMPLPAARRPTECGSI